MSDSSESRYKTHVALNVRNVKSSVDFYRRMFGVEPSKLRPGYAKFDLAAPALNLALNEAPVNEKGALSHMGIQVDGTEAVLRMKQRWVSARLEPRDEMHTTCCYALQDKSWVRDPDGNQWEVFAVLEDNLSASSACCGVTPQRLVTLE